MTDQELDTLRQLGEELRQTFADERHAIATLDHGRLELLAETKRRLAGELTAVRADTRAPELRELFAAIQVEARATALLAAAAAAAVRGLLGYEPSAGYDRRARNTTHGPSRILTAY